MTVKIDGSNGLLANYDYQTPTTGFTYTFTTYNVLFAVPAGTLATGTVTMSATPVDGTTITITTTQQITALTINANTGQSIIGGGAVQMNANTSRQYMYRAANTTWYLVNVAAGNVVASVNGATGIVTGVIVSGTAVASTSGTSIDFTSIPSWVKRITVMFNGVSTNNTSNLLVQIGAGSVTTSGYASTSTYAGNGSTAGVASTAGFNIFSSNASNVTTGHLVITLVGSNLWVSSHSLGINTAGTIFCLIGGGAVTLGGTLDRVRITTTNGTDTFDAGSINILYE